MAKKLLDQRIGNRTFDVRNDRTAQGTAAKHKGKGDSNSGARKEGDCCEWKAKRRVWLAASDAMHANVEKAKTSVRPLALADEKALQRSVKSAQKSRCPSRTDLRLKVSNSTHSARHTFSPRVLRR